MLTPPTEPLPLTRPRCRMWTAPGATLVALLLMSCDPAVGDDEGGVMVSDSAGVTLVGNPGPLDTDLLEVSGMDATVPASPRLWRLDGPPILRLGSEVDRAPDFFGRINSAHLDARGDLWVVDATTSELAVFAVPSGEHLFTTGGRGDGPGEFQLPFPIGFDEDSAWIWDPNPGRLTVLTLEGELRETRRVGQDLELVPRLLHRRADGTFLAQLPRTMAGPVTDGMTVQDTLRIWSFESEPDNPVLLAEREGVTWYFDGRMQVAVPFAQGSRFGAFGARIVLTDPQGAAAFDMVDDGRLTHRVRVGGDRTPVTSHAIERELDSPVRSQAVREVVRANLSELALPDFVPTWEWVRIGRSGHIFLLRYGGLTSDEVWDVFDADGVHLGALELPEETHLADADHRYLVLMEVPETRGPGIALHEIPEGWGGGG